jgi:hypothetical protein
MGERILFGEYLIQKGLLDAPTVLGLLVEQIKGQPSVAEIVYSNSLLSETQQLEVLRTQSRTGWDYQQACVDLKLWNDSLATTIMEKSSQGRMPLGQMIVTRGLVGFADLTRVLDEFVGMCESDGAPAVPPAKAPPSVPAVENKSLSRAAPATAAAVGSAPAPSQVSQPAQASAVIDAEPQFTSIDPALLTEFFEVLPEARSQEVATITASWIAKAAQGSDDAVEMEFRALAREMESIHAAARFVRAELIERLMRQGQVLAENVSKNEGVFGECVNEIAGACNAIYEAAWSLRSSLALECSEKVMWMSPDGKAAYSEAFASVERACARAAA